MCWQLKDKQQDKTSPEVNKKWQLFSGQLPTATGRAQRAPRTVHVGRHNRERLAVIAQGPEHSSCIRGSGPGTPRHSPVPEALCRSQTGRARRPHKGHCRNCCTFLWSHWLWNKVALCRSFPSINYLRTGYMSSCYHLGKESSKIPYPCLTLISSITWRSMKPKQRRCKSTGCWDFFNISAVQLSDKLTKHL